MDERGAGASVVPGPLPATPAGAHRFLRSATAGSARQAGDAGGGAWHRGILLLALLVPRQTAAGSSVQRGARVRPAGFSVLPLVGQRKLGTPLAWLGRFSGGLD